VAGDNWGTSFEAEGREFPADDPPSAVFRVASPDYLRAMGMSLRQGRSLEETDGPSSPGVVLVNEALARLAWPDGDAVGRRLRTGRADSPGPWLTVVGVYGDARQASLTEPVRPELIRPYAQDPTPWFRRTTLVVASPSDARALADAVKAAVWRLDADLPLTDVKTMREILRDAVGEQQWNAALLGLFAVVALLLALGGMYGVMTYSVALRTREIALRMALGAPARQVFGRVVGHGMALAGLGCAIGLLAAIALSRVVAGLVFGVSATDPATFAALTGALLAASLLACAGPAWRAARVDPLVALRD
jgi:putative ABC transport system permease protein